MTALITADTCPLCRRVHGLLDAFWACPKPEHGHRLIKLRDDGDFEIYTCPVHGCKFTRPAPRKPKYPSKGDPMTAAQSRPSGAVDVVWARAEHLKQLLPASLDLDSFIGTAQAALYNNAKLMAAAENDPASLMIALTECAALGHYPDGKRYYLTPRGKGERIKVLGVEGYRGIVQRMYNSGLVGKVVVREVCERDHFQFTEGIDDYPRHFFGGSRGNTGGDFFGKEGSVDRGEMVGVYAYAKLIDGNYTRVSLLSREDVFAARASGGWTADDEYNPWNRYDAGKDHPEFKGRSMWWKTALKRSEPWTPTSSEDKRQLQRTAPVEVIPLEPKTPPAPSVTAGNGKRQAIAAVRQKPAQRPQKAAQEPAQPAGRSKVTEALMAAIGQRFDSMDITDPDERDGFLHQLANKPNDDELTDHDLRGALGDLAKLDDRDALVKWCSAEPETS